MYEKRKGEDTEPHPRTLSPPEFHITLNPLCSFCLFCISIRTPPTPHNIQRELLALLVLHSDTTGTFFFSDFPLSPFHQQASFIAMKMKAMPQCHLKISARFVKVTDRTGGQNYAQKCSCRRHILSCEETVQGRERQMKFLSSPNLKINFICLQHFQPKPLLPNDINEFQFIC